MKKGFKVKVKQIDGFSAKEFESWLLSGFRDMSFEERELIAFAPLHYFIGYHDNVILDLKTIYDALSGTGQKNFRLGVVSAFSGLAPYSQNYSLVTLFLQLAGKCPVHEILPEIVKQIGNGYFGKPNNDSIELFALSLDIISGMAPYCEVGNALRQLEASTFFRPQYAPMTFIALCRAEPDNFLDHFDLLRSHFFNFHKEKGKNGTTITTRRFVHCVNLELISKKIWWLNLTSRPGADNQKHCDNWFGEALFLADDAPLRLTKGDHFYISRNTEREGKKYKIAIPYTDTSPKQSHEYDIRKYLNSLIEKLREKECIHNIRTEPDSLEKYIRTLSANIFSLSSLARMKKWAEESL